MGSSLFVTTEEMLALKKQEEEEKKKTKTTSGGGGTAGAFGEEEKPKETKPKEPKFITTAEMLELKKKDVPEQSTFDYLNTSIEKNYTTAMKLEKELTEFDTSMEGIPDEFKPSFVSNYNKKLTDFNTLVSGIKEDIAKRDEIIKTKNMQIFIMNKHLGFNQPQGEVMPEPTWGEVIKHSITSGLGQYQSSLVNFFRLIDMGVTKLTDPITKIISIDKEKAKKFKEKYGVDPNINTTDMLTKIVDESEKIASLNDQQAQSKNKLKEFARVAIEPIPQIVGSAALGAGMPVAEGIASAKPLAEMTSKVIQMIPFGVSGVGGHARDIEKEFENLGKEAPYLNMVVGGLLGGAGEMATELPVFLGVSKLLKGGLKGVVNEGAKTLVGRYGKAGIEFIKDLALQSWQEAEMEPIQNAITRAMGLPQDKIIDLKQMGEAAWGGMAMALGMFMLGGGVGGSAMVANKALQKVDDFMQNKDDIRGTLLKIAQIQGIIPEGGEEVALAYTPEEEAYAKKYDIPVEKVRIEKLKKADVTSETVSEETINKLEEKFGTRATPESVLKKVKESVSQEKQKVEGITEEEITQEVKKYEKTVGKTIDKYLKTEKENSQIEIDKNNKEIKSIQEMLDKGIWFEGGKKISPEDIKGMEGKIKELNEKNKKENKRLSEYIEQTEKDKKRYIKEFEEELKLNVIPIEQKAVVEPVIKEKVAPVPVTEKTIVKEEEVEEAELTPEEIKRTFGEEEVDIKALNKFFKAEEEYPAKIIKEEKRDIKQVKIKDIPKDEMKTGNNLIRDIQVLKNNKGLTDTQFSDIKMKVGGARHLSGKVYRMSLPKLQDVLKAIEKARPNQVGYKKVVTLKTENKIQSLKDNLIDKLQMDEATYKKILESEGVYKEAKYIDAKHFITEEQGKKIIYRLIDEAEILKITLPLKQAVEKNPAIKKIVDKIESRIRTEGDRRTKDPHELNSMRKYIQIMEKIMNSPIFSVYQSLIDVHLENKAKMSEFINSYEEYKDLMSDEKSLLRVEHYIASKTNLLNKPEMPKDITAREVELANKIEKVLEDYQARARTEKFLDNIEHLEKMPQYIEYKKEIDKALDIYESKGYDDLVEYMKTQEWGVIESGYSPYQVISTKVREYEPAPTTFNKGHIKVRNDIEYREQDRNIIQRLFSYKKSMDNLVEMRPKIRAFITLINKDLDKFENPSRVERNISTFLNELKGYNRADNWFDRGINRLYAQAMQVIIMPSAVLSGRNLLQNAAFGFDKSILIDPRNKSLTKDEITYLNTYLKQTEFMKADWFMVGEKPLPGLGLLTKLINKIGIYPYSDLANRHMAFWGKINQVKRAFNNNDSLAKQMEAAKFSDMELIEQKRALEILAKDGKEEMTKYVARVYVDDIHFLYDRSQRSPAEMGRVGKWFGNLMLFPRAYWEMLHKQGGKMVNKNIPIKERLRSFKVIANVIGGGILVGAAFQMVTGRQDNPYDPLQLLAYEPGGLAIGTVQAATAIYTDIIKVAGGDMEALKSLATDLPAAADMFIPFYAYLIRGIEASTDSKNIDRKAIRKLIMLIDKEYEVRGGAYKLERNAMEKWQYFLSGAGIDVKIKEEAKTKIVPTGRIDIRKELTGGRIDIRKELGGRIDIRKELQ